MDRIYKYNQDASYEPHGGRYLQIMSAKDLYIQNITVVEHDGHSDSFQVKFPNVFTHYPNNAVRVEDQKFKDWDHYKFTLWQSQLNFVVFCASSACGVSVEHLNAKEPMIRSDFGASDFDAQQAFLNTFENIIVKRVNIPEDKLRLQKVLQYARSKVDFVIGEKMCMIPSDMNLRIGKIKNYNNKILESKSYFKLGINEKINLDQEKAKPDVKPEGEGILKTKPDVK